MLQTSTLQFLNDLKENNNREWFLDHKKQYENYKKDYHQLIAELLQMMVPKDSNLAHLEVKNCTFRINRDIRFSKDKSPYKNHMGIWMSVDKNRKNAPGYYLQIQNDEVFVAGGIWCPEADELKKVRKEIAFFYEDLDKIIADKNFKKEFTDLDRDPKNMLKTSPKDFDKEHVAIEFLKLKSFTASQKLDSKILVDKNFTKIISDKLLVLKPLNAFLNRALTTE